MAAKTNLRLGDLQLKIMRVLWEHGPLGLPKSRRAARRRPAGLYHGGHDVAQNGGPGLVGHRTEDRRFIYEPSVAADDVARTMSGDLVDRLFDGSLARTVSHLLKTREVDRRELDELEELIRRQRSRE